MDLLETMTVRHSVRKFTKELIGAETVAQLEQLLGDINQESGLHLQLCLEEPEAFAGFIIQRMVKNAKNYLALIGRDEETLSEKAGYFGEKFVLAAQALGLNSHWIATYNDKKALEHVEIAPDEKLVILIALGYGENQGTEHQSKPLEKLGSVQGQNWPAWFKQAIQAVQLAPSAMNRQDVHFALLMNGQEVKADSGSGTYSKLDLGIAKYHFEAGAGAASWHWTE